MRATPSSPTYSSTRRPVRFATRSLGSDGGAQPLARWRVERASVGERPGDEYDVTLERGRRGASDALDIGVQRAHRRRVELVVGTRVAHGVGRPPRALEREGRMDRR